MESGRESGQRRSGMEAFEKQAEKINRKPSGQELEEQAVRIVPDVAE